MEKLKFQRKKKQELISSKTKTSFVAQKCRKMFSGQTHLPRQSLTEKVHWHWKTQRVDKVNQNKISEISTIRILFKESHNP